MKFDDISAKNSNKFVYYNENYDPKFKFSTQFSLKLQRFRGCRKDEKCSINHAENPNWTSSKRNNASLIQGRRIVYWNEKSKKCDFYLKIRGIFEQKIQFKKNLNFWTKIHFLRKIRIFSGNDPSRGKNMRGIRI